MAKIIDENPDYWQRDQFRQRDARLLDNHFNNRSRGQRLANGQDPSVRAYAIPKSQQIALKENPVGGLPVWNGADMAYDPRYAQAQAQLAQRGQVPSLPNPWQGQSDLPQVREVDINQLMAQRMGNMATPAGPTHGPQPGHAMATGQQSFQQQSQMVRLQEGHTFFRTLNIQGFGTATPLVRTGGRIQGVEQNQFQVQGTVRCYLVDGMQTVDLTKIQESRMITLVQVQSPLIGAFLVPQEAIIQENGMGGNRQLLVDSRYQQGTRPQQVAQQQPQRLVVPQPARHQPPQQQQVNQMGADLLRRRGLLKG